MIKFILSKKKKIIIISAILAVIVIFVALKLNSKPQSEYITADVKRGDLVQTVSEVGTVKASKEVELNFPQVGKLAKINVAIGDKVVRDQVLAELDSSQLAIREREAESSLAVAAANQNKLVSGASFSDVAITRAQLSQAKVAYDNTVSDLEKIKKTQVESLAQAEERLSDLLDTNPNNQTQLNKLVSTAKLNLENGQRSYQQAIDSSRDSFMSAADHKITVANSALDNTNNILTNDGAKSYLSSMNISYLVQTKESYTLASDLMVLARQSYVNAKNNPSEVNLSALYLAVDNALDETFKMLNSCYKALENSVTSSSFSQSSLDTFKATINTQLSSVSAAISALQASKSSMDSASLNYQNGLASLGDAVRQAEVNLNEAIKSARNGLSTLKVSSEQQLASAQSRVDSAKEAWDLAQKQLQKIQAPARSEDIALAEAQVKQAEANLDLIRKQQNDNLIKAPIDGQITKINFEIGEQVTGAKPMMTMLTENNFEIEVDISESDISKVRLDNQAQITFDAFGESRKFLGQVYSIEPAATVIQDVIYYKVKINLASTTPLVNSDNSQNIKSGMTANIIINTNKKSNILIIPIRAVVDKNGQGKFVRLFINNQDVREIPVELGLSGDEGLIEVVSGALREGDKVVTMVKTKTSGN